MADLITSDRAKVNLAGDGSFSSDDDTLIAALVSAVSKAVRRHCRREFDSQTFDELCDGTNRPALVLRQFPVISIARVAYGPTAVLRVTNTSGSNQRASVSVAATGLSLVRVASGTSTTSTPTFAGNATLSALATAITALGSGWSASVVDARYNNWPSVDLRAIQGALNAKDVTAELKHHVNELDAYELAAETGILTRSAWLIPGVEDDASLLTWFGGRSYWRVIYTAGFATVPEDVQEACAEWVAYLYFLAQRDPALANSFASAAGSTYTRVAAIPGHVAALLAPYRKHIL